MRILRIAFVYVMAFLCIAPLFWMVSMAFKPSFEWTSAGGAITLLPKDPTLANFEYAFTGESASMKVSLDRTVWWPFFASLLTAAVGTVIAVVVGTMAAYAVSRHKVSEGLGLSFLQLRIFPPLAVMIPVMIMWAYLGMIDTWWGLALIYGIVTLPFAFWLMKAYFDELPREIEEAAFVEGCSPWRTFTRITLPIVRPAIASTSLFIFILNWSDYLVALLLTRKEWTTLPVYLSQLATAVDGELFGVKSAVGLLAIIPPVVLGISIQRFLVRGLTFGALKQ
jgi:multiple sugar transport system permease protein